MFIEKSGALSFFDFREVQKTKLLFTESQIYSKLF